MIQGHRSKAEAQPAAPGGQQHSDKRNSLFLKLCHVQAWQRSAWWLSPIDILCSPSITFSCWWVSWEVFLFHGICIFCNWFFMCSDVCCSASMPHRIQCAMSKADEISKQKLLLELMLHPQDSALFNHKATQRSSAPLCSWWKSLFGEAEIQPYSALT